MLALLVSIAVLALSVLAEPIYYLDARSGSPYFTFKDGLEPWRIYRQDWMYPDRVPVDLEDDVWFSREQAFLYKTSSPGASVTFNSTGSVSLIRGYLNSTMDPARLQSTNIISVTVNGEPVPVNSLVGTGVMFVNIAINNDSWFDLRATGGLPHSITVTLGPEWEGEICVKHATSHIFPPALDMSMVHFPNLNASQSHVHLFHTMNRTNWIWEGEWERVKRILVLETSAGRAEFPFAHGKKGSKVTGLLPENATMFMITSLFNRDTGMMVTVDPPPVKSPSPNPFISSTNQTFGPSLQNGFFTELDPAQRYTVTIEAINDGGCYLESAVAFPYDMLRVTDPTYWPGYYTDPGSGNGTVGSGTSSGSSDTSSGTGGEKASQDDTGNPLEKKTTNTGVIAGAIVAALAGFAVVAGLVTWYLVRGRRKQNDQTKRGSMAKDLGLGDKHELIPYGGKGYGGSHPSLGSLAQKTTPTRYLAPLPLSVGESGQYTGHSTKGARNPFGDDSSAESASHGSVSMTMDTPSSDRLGSHPLPDDGTLLAAVREALSQEVAQRGAEAPPGVGLPFDKAAIVMAVRHALAESALASNQPPVSESSSPFSGPNESTIIADLKGISSSSTPSGASATTRQDDVLAGTTSRNPSASMAHAAHTEEKALLMAIKDVVGQARDGGRGRRAARTQPVRVRHDEDGGTFAIAPTLQVAEEVLPPMYNPQWENRRRGRQDADGAQ
ncbi:hypothetical protein CcaverHIS002_0607890 [Cutaneotrichosporon cavernicola]|uniref:Mid2 domain-containing protein n=1 Tax=Cutaneotrichosporon cavernicola TaxID=279322 RepID=A0AA48QYG3_9TREE|nr:uncharacterized protein CcaverHIS019_0607340 [Cutaneotrichosporon cavernicola]BEI86502.1 hypothetical protein CcaverHIS002_0607890 [Cutaneotrichosporon cavernicola]BEI94275.1 hypothetical protein CcaverHIS019_0607340 [Cutaneotrichosporon cavernicola]BEJ02053.1 hypothetical protein CcaverHIS631_0607350 [Cutaneotrichosporon cavernicola]BEJ09814.1 hypothetical protein CcaverHIS641_0607290 [Cutaneotrichosporon cavernicola]